MLLPDDDQLLPNLMENDLLALDDETFLALFDDEIEELPLAKAQHDAPFCAITGQLLPEGTPLGGNVITYRTAYRRWPYDAQTAQKLDWGTKIDGKKVITYNNLIYRWPHDAQTGEKLPWGTNIDGKKVISYGNLGAHSPYDAQTAQKLPLGTTIDGKKVINHSTLLTRWPHDAQTGEKLPWGTNIDGKKVITHYTLASRWPHDAITAQKLPLGTQIDGKKVITASCLKERWPHDAQTAQKLPWGTKIDSKKVITYDTLMSRRPHDAQTGEKLPWGTKIDGKKVITRAALHGRRPYDAQTGNMLPKGTKVDGKKVITKGQMGNKWPYDAVTGEKLPWGTKVDGKKVITHSELYRRYPRDAQTGEKLPWGTKIDGKTVVTYQKLLELRPMNKITGKSLDYGTPIQGDIVTNHVFCFDYTFIDAEGNRYKGLAEKEAALEKNPTLILRSIRERNRKNRLKKRQKAQNSENASSTNPPKSKLQKNKQPLVSSEIDPSLDLNISEPFLLPPQTSDTLGVHAAEETGAPLLAMPSSSSSTAYQAPPSPRPDVMALVMTLLLETINNASFTPSYQASEEDSENALLSLNLDNLSVPPQTPDILGMHAAEETRIPLAMPSSSSAAYQAPTSPGPEVIALFEQMTSDSTFAPAYQGTTEDNPHKRAKAQNSSSAETPIDPLIPLSPSFFQQG